jgi:hypothetical protein
LLIIEGIVGANFPFSSFRHVKTCEGILAIETLEEKYSSESDTMPQLFLPRTSHDGKKDRNRECKALFIGRLERMRSHLAALDGNGNLQIFRGANVILSLDFRSLKIDTFCHSTPYEELKQMLVASRPVSLSKGKDWRINIHMKNGKMIRVNLDILHKDNLVNSILQAIQAAISKPLFVSFYSDFLEIIQVALMQK